MICCIPFNDQDKARAERLADCIFWLGGQKPIGHCLLAIGHDVHAEYRRKVTIAAQVAFNSVDVLHLPSITGTKSEQTTAVLRQVAKHVQEAYNKPWLYMESDCVPLKASWMSDLFSAYSQQPKRYFGKYVEADGKRLMSRTGIYPGDFHKDAGTKISLATTDLIHIETWKEGLVLPPTALLLNGDRSGQLIEQLIEAAPVTTDVTLKRGPGRPRTKVTA